MEPLGARLRREDLGEWISEWIEVHRPLAFEVRLLVALEHRFRAFPPAQFTQHLERLVFVIGGQFCAEGCATASRVVMEL